MNLPTSRENTLSVPVSMPSPIAKPCCNASTGKTSKIEMPGKRPIARRNRMSMKKIIMKFIVDDNKTIIGRVNLGKLTFLSKLACSMNSV